MPEPWLTVQRRIRMMSFLGGRYVLIANVSLFLVAGFTAFQMDYVLRVGLKRDHWLEPWMLLLPFIVALVVRNVFLSFVFVLIYLATSYSLFGMMSDIADSAFTKRIMNTQMDNIQVLFYGTALFSLIVYLLIAGIGKLEDWRKR